MLSKVIGVARLTKEVEVRYSSSGTAIASLSLVNSNKRKNANGEQVEDVCFINATCFSKLAEIAEKWLSKGSQIYYIGELKQDNWVDKDGNKKSNHTIVLDSFEMLSSNSNTPQSTDTPQNNQTQDYSTQKQENELKNESVPEIDIDDDEIPF